MTRDAARPIATTQEGDWFQAPFVDARRSAGNTNDLRGKVLRINVNADGSYTSPAGNLFPESQDTDDKTRPEIYAMGFRNPFRIQVDDNDVAYVTDYSPDSDAPENFRGPAGTGRVEVVRKAVQLRLAAVRTRRTCRTTAGTSTPASRSTPTPTPYECGNPEHGPAEPRRAGTPARPSTRRPSRAAINVPPITQPDIWYSFRDNANPPLGTPCLAYYNGSGGTLPAALPRALHDRRRPARRGAVPLRRGEPEHDEVPALLRRRVRPRRVQRGHAARGPRRQAGPDLQDQPVPGLRRRAVEDARRSRSSATTRWTCSSAPTATTTC